MMITTHNIATLRTLKTNLEQTTELLEECIDEGRIHVDETDPETLRRNITSLERMIDEFERNAITHRDYRNAIETEADEIEEYIDDYADLSEAVFEAADSLYVYTHHQLQVLQVSDTEPSMELAPERPTFQEAISAMCYDCVQQDLTEELRERGHDV